MTKLLLVAAALWVFLLPAFCVAGLVHHACTTCDHEAACAHEDHCGDDPCAEVFLRPAEPELPALDELATAAPVPVLALLDDLRWLPASADEPVPRLPRLPYPPADRPLLN
ncbi:MAG: hypothetical protein R6X25_06080 [Candidatus Krumholzibacteriia bacterium]